MSFIIRQFVYRWNRCTKNKSRSHFLATWFYIRKNFIEDDEVLVKVHAFGINRADTAQRKGRYPPPPGVTDIIGLEASGEIVNVGNEAKQQWNNGDKVWIDILDFL